jgi:NodT family efflux transporter outer membrane factor (OMF) lipoprotein
VIRSRTSLTALSCLTLAACSFAPVYKVPPSPQPAPSQYQELPDDWKPAQPLDAIARGAWWEAFSDPQLNELETRASQDNQNLKAAYARLREARDDTRVARADYWPMLTGAASESRARTSPNSPRIPPGTPPLGNDFDVEADVSYELDLWGRVRNEVASAKASQQASAADVASMNLSLCAQVAMDYYRLRSEDRQIVLLDQAVSDFGQSLQLTQNLYNGGAAALVDVAQAQAQLANARTQAADVRLQRSQSEHAMAVLLGETPSSYHLPPNPMTRELLPPALDPGLPSALLERRPDVAEAERRVAAANAQIGVARAAYFPRFDIAGTAGFNSAHASNWLTAPSLFWSLGPQVSVPLFEGGRLRAQTDRAKAVYTEQVANYRNTVLSAYQDVEDNLAALRQLELESYTQADAVEATDVTLQQAQYRYRAGAATYLEVAIAETNALQAQLAAVSIQTRRLNASVLLVKALGGGWQQAGSTLANNRSLSE